MLSGDAGTTLLSNTSIEKVAVVGFLVDAHRVNPGGRGTSPAAGISEADPYSPHPIMRAPPPRLRCARLLTHQCLDCSLAFLARRPVPTQINLMDISSKFTPLCKYDQEEEVQSRSSRTRNSSAGGENI